MVLALGIGAARAETRWTAVEGDGYTVVTDAGAGAAAKMAVRIEQMRALLGGPVKTLPLRVVLLSQPTLFAALRPSETAGGFYQSSADDDWVVVRWGRPDSERAMSHEIVHAFLEHHGPRRPLWLEEGLAEFYSTAALDAKGWTIGTPIESHVRVLNDGRWLGEREFLEAAFDSPLRDEGSREGKFYAQSWALVHFLLTAPGVREKSPELFTALADGAPFARACERAFGMRQGLLLDAARRAVEQRRFATARITAGTVSRPAGVPAALAAEEANALLVALALAAGKPDVARRMAASPVQRGLLALADGNRAAAERLFEEAVANGSKNAAPYFELAMLLREERRELTRVPALLRAAIERNPNHAEAHFLLGLRAAAAGDDEGAIDYFQTAARILPRQASFWHALALSLERTGRMAEASHAAMRCRQAARNAAEREMAAAIERLIRQPEAPLPASGKPAVHVPDGWRGLRGDTSADGELVAFHCESTPPVAHIVTGRERLELRVEKPSAIRIGGTGSVRHTLPCGEMKAAVRVEYIGRTKELTAIEFR
ncbi:MAG: DUF1570 domain-containing protein [Acidobacteria bacterium]|nr:DUF1570 domain-containing protein [Acidobacteriota bacterium]